MTPLSQDIPSVIVPELFRVTGGVQVFSRRMITALDEIYGCPVPVVSRNDRTTDCPEDFLKNRRFTGCGGFPPSLRRFAIMAATLKTSGRLTVSTHPHFTPWLKILRKPYITVAHGIDVWNIRGSKLCDGLRQARRVLPVSRYTEARIKEQLGNDLPEFTVFPNTFDAERFTPGKITTPWRDRLGIPASAKVMLSVCRVAKTEREKGYHDVLESMPNLAKKHPDLHWILGGKGDDLEDTRAKATELGVANRCHFPGFVPDEELVDLYRSSDLFVLPSRKEGFGIVFLEAAATGLPVIAGNKDGSVDALADGALGTLIDPFCRNSLSSAISTIVQDPVVDRESLHADCSKRFGMPAFTQRLRDILADLS